ncbi:unnamed protein product [Prunus armeniaca]|uniref:Uncharacterized protein n=1 Tax=Prunus armeniaca TaxID=36596 RepID=A0A6J5VKH0_PRUAR|nr:unnamed protein product [Prunus armeniaca]
MGIGGAMVFSSVHTKAKRSICGQHMLIFSILMGSHTRHHTKVLKSFVGMHAIIGWLRLVCIMVYSSEFLLSLFKHSSNVPPDGVNSICSFSLLRGEGLEAMEVGTYGFIFGNLDLRTCSDPNDMGCKEGRAILCFGFSACAACDVCTCRLFPP